MINDNSLNWTDLDIFYVEQLSGDQNPQRNSSPQILNSTALSGSPWKEVLTISSVPSPETHFITITSDSNDITISYGYGRQDPIIPPSLGDLNLPPNPFKTLAMMKFVPTKVRQCGERDSLQSPVPSELSSISTSPMMMGTIEPGETFFDEGTIYSDIKPRRNILHSRPSISPISPPSKKQKRKMCLRRSFLKKRECRSTVCEACAQVLPEETDIPCPSTK